jgi:hypothetical protein
VKDGITLYALIGNHDIFYRNTLKVNSPQLLLSDYANIRIIDRPSMVQFGTMGIDIIPWICEENEKEVNEFINQSKNGWCFGHLEGIAADRTTNTANACRWLRLGRYGSWFQ